ncbi:hypothetical protein V6N12_073548 [Hibiscus sabdariffa]|uniref:Uncharacterized protein n=1 Tax=Hibiscus sabdariffa TaxID=183260 RepID=A0ABR2BHG2_9ROSI
MTASAPACFPRPTCIPRLAMENLNLGGSLAYQHDGCSLLERRLDPNNVNHIGLSKKTRIDVSLPTMPDNVIVTPVPLTNLPQQAVSLNLRHEDVFPDLPQQDMENAKAISTPISSSDKLPPPEPSTTIDISSAIYVCKNIVFHSCMKHLALDYFFVRDLIDAESLLVQYIPSKAQIADTLTKSLGRNLFHHFRPKIEVSDGSFILRGRIKET